jgi:hypothetical protein
VPNNKAFWSIIFSSKNNSILQFVIILVALAQRLLFLETHKFSIFSFLKEKKIVVKEK